ncbi:hypothetical protein BDV06DRAFT_233219 [Aspergillus oleicola]
MSKPPFFPGFHAITDQIFTRDALTDTTTTPSVSLPHQPRAIILFAWGDAHPKHVTKYLDGFRTLYPASNQVAVLSPILRTITRSMEQRSESMKPVLDAVYGSDDPQKHDNGVLVLAMSNTGGIAYAATLHAYFKKYNRAMPHRLLALDSTPGSTDLSLANMKRLSLAMALGVSTFFPWPFVVTQVLSGLFLYLIAFIEMALGRKSAGLESVLAIDNRDLCSMDARRLYLYGKEDRIIAFSDIEKHVAKARKEGWKADCAVFEGSGHVEHMRRDAVRYWEALQGSWEAASKGGNL